MTTLRLLKYVICAVGSYEKSHLQCYSRRVLLLVPPSGSYEEAASVWRALSAYRVQIRTRTKPARARRESSRSF